MKRTLPTLVRVTREIGLVAAVLLVYFLIRGSVVDQADEATRNAAEIISFQQRLGIFWEPRLQARWADTAGEATIWNWAYFWLHAPLIVVVGVWLMWRHPHTYRVTRNAFLVTALIALAFYALYPVSPPRLMPGYDFVDTMRQYSEVSYQAQSLKPFVNPYAAMPSLHVGWSLLLGVGVLLAWRDARGVAFAVSLIGVMSVAVVMTGNHYIVDGGVGMVVAALGLLGAVAWERRGLWRRSSVRRAAARGAL